jgi:hypothetical protein
VFRVFRAFVVSACNDPQQAERMARFLVPKEYGVRARDKMVIGSLVSGPLFHHMCNDVRSIRDQCIKGFDPPGDARDTASGWPADPPPRIPIAGKPTTRLYFSSESHLQTLRNVLIHSGIGQLHDLIEPVELNYLTQILFLVWEDIPIETPASKPKAANNSKPGPSASDGDAASAVTRASSYHGGKLDPALTDVIERASSFSDDMAQQPSPREERFFVEVRFSPGASKNPWGITGRHFNEVGPAVTLHDSLSIKTLDAMERIVRGVQSSYGGQSS